MTRVPILESHGLIAPNRRAIRNLLDSAPAKDFDELTRLGGHFAELAKSQFMAGEPARLLTYNGLVETLAYTVSGWRETQ